MTDEHSQPDPRIEFAFVVVPAEDVPDPYADLAGVQGVKLHEFIPTKKFKPRLIGEVIPQVGLGDLNGETRIGKTHVHVAMAVCLATGKPFLGVWRVMEIDGQDRSERGEIGITLVVLGEGRDDFDDRLQAAYMSLDSHSKARLKRAGFKGLPVILVEASNLSRPSRYKEFRERVLEIKKQIDRPEQGVQVEMIVFDTVSSVFNFSDENSASSVQPSMNALVALAEEASVFCLLVSHPAKGRSKREPRGSNAFMNSPDVILSVVKRPKVKLGGAIRVEKVRDRETPTKLLPFTLSPVELPNGQTGVIATASNHEPEQTETGVSRSPNKASMLAGLIEDVQASSPCSIDVDGWCATGAALKEDVREAYFAHELFASVKRDTKVKYFNDALRALKKSGRVEEAVIKEDGRNVGYLRMAGLSELGTGD